MHLYTDAMPRLRVSPGDADAVISNAVAMAKAKRQRTDAEMSAMPVHDPPRFVREVLHDDPWDLQEEILYSVRDNQRTSSHKCHASGLTRAAAQAVCWWLMRYDDGVVWTLAPSWTQVRHLLWKDIEDLYNKATPSLGGKFLPDSARWEFGPRHYAMGRSTDKAENLQGPHGDNLLIIIDEASGFKETLEPAVEGMLASGNAHLLLLGQPTKLSGMFYRSAHQERRSYNVIPISAFDTPNLRANENIRPYLIQKEWVEDRKRAWGETNPLYQVRVLGQFPSQAANSVVSLTWITEALAKGVDHTPRSSPRPSQRNPQWGEGVSALGIDIARFGTDYTAYTLIETLPNLGPCVTAQWRRAGKDLMETAGEIARWFGYNKRLSIAVDDTGLGGGVTDRLNELDIPNHAVNFGASSDDEDSANMSTQIWFGVAGALQDGLLAIANIDTADDLTAQLVQPVYSFTSSGKRKIAKAEKGQESPDLGDSLALAWYAYERADLAFEGVSVEHPLHAPRPVFGDPDDEQVLPSQRRSRLWG